MESGVQRCKSTLQFPQMPNEVFAQIQSPQFTSSRSLLAIRESDHGRFFGRGAIKVTLGGHSALDPPLPIPNRAVKRSRADDSVHSHAKVGHCQAPHKKKPRSLESGLFYWRKIQPFLAAAAFPFLAPVNQRRGNAAASSEVPLDLLFLA